LLLASCSKDLNSNSAEFGILGIEQLSPDQKILDYLQNRSEDSKFRRVDEIKHSSGSQINFYQDDNASNFRNNEELLVIVSNPSGSAFITFKTESLLQGDSIRVKMKNYRTGEVFYDRTFLTDILHYQTDEPDIYQGCYDDYNNGGNLASCINCVTDIFVDEDLLNLVTYEACSACVATAAGLACAFSELGNNWTDDDITHFIVWLGSIEEDSPGSKYTDNELIDGSLLIYLKK
jgi:hypothetical protein